MCGGESSRYRDGSCANVVAWRCTCACSVSFGFSSIHHSVPGLADPEPREWLVRRVVPDGVVGPQANPLGDGAVLLLRAGKLLLGAEGLVGLRSCQNSPGDSTSIIG